MLIDLEIYEFTKIYGCERAAKERRKKGENESHAFKVCWCLYCHCYNTRTHVHRHMKPYHTLYLITINSHKIKFTVKIYLHVLLTSSSLISSPPPSTVSPHSDLTFEYIDILLQFFLFLAREKWKKKSSPRINFPIYPLFITTFIKRNSLFFFAVRPRKNGTLQTTSTRFVAVFSGCSCIDWQSAMFAKQMRCIVRRMFNGKCYPFRSSAWCR